MKKICMILVLCLMATFAYGQGKSDGILIVATGEDQDIPGAVTFIKAEIKVNEATGQLVGQVEFRTIVHNEAGERVFTIEGKLESSQMLMPPIPPEYGVFNYCDVRKVSWIKYWIFMGAGKVKTTGNVPEEFEYRGEIITIPNTYGQYVDATIGVLVSPEGEYIDGEYVVPEPYESGFWGGWTFAGFFLDSGETFGGITWLRTFLDTRTP